MSKEEKVVLQETKQFVQKMITEVYGQRATKASVLSTAKRIVETLPAKPATIKG